LMPWLPQQIDVLQRKMLRMIVGWVRLPSETWEVTMHRMNHRVENALQRYPVISWRRRLAKCLWKYVLRIKAAPSDSWIAQSWKLSKELMLQARPCSPIPALLDTGGKWITEASDKANLFAHSFLAKSELPTIVTNEFSSIDDESHTSMSGFLPIRLRHAEQILQKFDEGSATGSDHLSTRILKSCSKSLALPIVLLSRMILEHGVWPRIWCKHWVFPLHKKKTKSNTGNYRGVHLTPQISKVVERLLGKLFLPYLDKSGAFGLNQFAYRRKHSFMDVLALNVMAWITAFGNHLRVGLYCSDVSGAFDRINTKRLLQKLKMKGLHPSILEILSSWLKERQFTVIVDGSKSKWHNLGNSVYQGTVGTAFMELLL
jgi:hypothetical protein